MLHLEFEFAAHLKVREHDKAFYQLCYHMAADYAQLEFDLRLYLTHLDQLKSEFTSEPSVKASAAGH